MPAVLGRAAWRAAVGRHRFVDGRRADAGGEQPAGQDLHDRIRGTGIQRGETRRAASRAHLGTDHTELLLTGEDALCAGPAARRTSSTSRSPTRRSCRRCLVSQLARRHVTVALCGDGGDELFGGYNRYVYGTRMLPRVDRGSRARPARLSAPESAASRRRAWDRVRAMAVPRAGRRRPAIRRAGPEDRRVDGRQARSATCTGRCSPPGSGRDELLDRRVDADDTPGRSSTAAQPAHLLDRMMLADQSAYLPDDLLARVDRASMAVSLEVRAPLLDHRVVEFSWRLPARMKLRGTTGKWMLRQVLYRRVPQRDHRSAEDGVLGADRPLAARSAAPLGREPARDGGIRRGGLLDPAPIRAPGRDLQRAGVNRDGAVGRAHVPGVERTLAARDAAAGGRPTPSRICA